MSTGKTAIRIDGSARPGTGGLARRLLFSAMLSAGAAFTLSACHQDMANGPKYVPLRESAFFENGQSSRPLVEGTVPRGYLKADREFFTGKSQGPAAASNVASPVGTPATLAPAPTPGQPGAASVPAAGQPAAASQDVTSFPVSVTEELLNRGQQRYNVFCTPCHGLLGDGEGMIVKRGFRHPPSYHIDRLRNAPVGHFFDVMTNGFGVMADYSQQISPQDRWAIVAYIRALQMSQNGTLNDVPADKRGEISGGRK